MLDPNAREFCFQTFAEGAGREGSKNLSRNRSGSLAHAADWLISFNDRGAGVFVTINETDGNGRRKENVTRVRAVMLDLDGQPLDPVHQCLLKPHIITETSEGRYHVFWLVDGLALSDFKAVQQKAANEIKRDTIVYCH
jgi:hypothetical protein